MISVEDLAGVVPAAESAQVVWLAAIICALLAVVAAAFLGESPEAALRRHLAAAHHLSHHFKFDDLVWNHVSARNGAQYLVTSGTHHFDEVTERNLVVSGADIANKTADVIHGAIYAARPDVHAIVHHHSPAVTAVSALADGLQFLSQDSAAFYGKVSYHDWEGTSLDYDERSRIAKALGADAHTLIMRNHGACTVGRNVGEAWTRYYILDRICAQQLAVAGQRVVQPDAEVLSHAAAQVADDTPFAAGKMEWPALLRMADRLRGRRGGPTARRLLAAAARGAAFGAVAAALVLCSEAAAERAAGALAILLEPAAVCIAAAVCSLQFAWARPQFLR
jgi:ribulose-5-phosphate 4-epimerase/fuculose-1-phosphate aldolase